MSTEQQEAIRETTAVLGGRHTSASVTDKIGSTVLVRPIKPGWLVGFGIGFLLTMVLLFAVTWLFIKGVGIWGINIPVAWGFAIINFVWWIGIGHAGTFISAFLLLMRQDWRTSINRFAEAMTLFAVACAGMMPLLHLGRPYYFYWLLPYPNTMAMWPQFRSPLVWDVFAVGTYATVSLVFWYMGLVPDLATFRDRARGRVARAVYGVFALGWRNSVRHWHRYRMAYLLLAGLATPLVISVHSVVGLDFASAILPGWHSTIFPPYFVGGAIFSGFAMVLTLAIPLRWAYRLQDMITLRHLDNCAKLMLVTGLIVAYGYVMETFMAWYSGNPYERYVVVNRALGVYAPFYWIMIVCNVLITQLLWFRRIRRSTIPLLIVSLLINVGMWMERFVIIVTSLQRDFLPSSWNVYAPTVWDWLIFTGSIGLFITLFYLFIRVLPAIAMFEMRELVHEADRTAPAPARVWAENHDA
ncbi:MAG TPA: polysulfide reductase NrfD [Phycisphaerae bacterium]|nr:polysulfide reductase NrfD [Phycisphaerae bacterium]